MKFYCYDCEIIITLVSLLGFYDISKDYYFIHFDTPTSFFTFQGIVSRIKMGVSIRRVVKFVELYVN